LKHPAGFRLAIVNPLTLVGAEIKTILRERAFPFDKVVLLDSTGEAAGALTDIGDEAAVVTAASAVELSDVDLAFFCGKSAGNREWIEAANGYIAVDLSQPTTAEDGKLAIAGINVDTLDATDRKLVSPHPIAIPIALILHEIEKVAAVELCTATVVQPASEFDEPGVAELAKQTIAVLGVQSVPQEVFGRQLAFNLYPALEHREPFIVSQIRSLTDVRPKIALLVTQGTIFHGHTFSLFVKTDAAVDTAKIENALKQNPAIAFPEGDQQFGTIDAAGKDEVLIAAVRAEPSIPGGFWIWAVCDNLRRSSALNAVLIAEKVLFGTNPSS
jgi:aspartate-semialdehyde dehydrogenase